MKKNDNTNIQYGRELGEGIKQGLQGINTMCSPKKRKTAIKLIVIPLTMFLVGVILVAFGLEQFAILGIGIFGLGLYQFYVGKFKMGIIYTITFGGFMFGCLIDLFKLCVTKTFKDANGFPLIY